MKEALQCMQLLVQKYYDLHKDVLLCFIDDQRAFDNILAYLVIRYDLLKPILQETDVDICIIYELYLLKSDSKAQTKLHFANQQHKNCQGFANMSLTIPI